MASTTPITISEIARIAGVGTATVDRVINGRPGVNPETVQKVLRAVEGLGKPPVTRGRPRTRTNLRFAYVLPHSHAKFFDALERRIAQQASEFRHQNITEVTYCFNVNDPTEFARELMGIRECNGIVILAPESPAIKRVIDEKVRSGVHVVTLLSDIAGSMREVYVGPDNRAAGRTAGVLLANTANAPQRDTLIMLAHPSQMHSEIERRIGFTQIIEEDFKHLKVVRTADLPIDDDGTYQHLKAFLEDDDLHSRVAGIYGASSTGTAGVARVLRELPTTHKIHFVAHDLTEVTQSLLIDRSLTYVIDQDNQYCISTAARVLRGLCENIRGAFQVAKPRIGILTPENWH
jgi:LacI family transcriptional regulator